MKWVVTGTVTISMHTEVEAETKEEALQKAGEQDVCDLIAPERMGNLLSDCWFHSGEIDGTPEPLDAEVKRG